MRKKGENNVMEGAIPWQNHSIASLESQTPFILTRLGSFKDEAVSDDCSKLSSFFKRLESTLLELEAKCSTSAAPRSAAMHSRYIS